MEIKITQSAKNRIAHLIAKNKSNVQALRIAVNGGGCSGFMYDYQFVDKINNDDYILELNSIKIIIDPLSQKFLNNSTLDFVNELGYSYFQIINPNAKNKCGCGNSFSS